MYFVEIGTVTFILTALGILKKHGKSALTLEALVKYKNAVYWELQDMNLVLLCNFSDEEFSYIRQQYPYIINVSQSDAKSISFSLSDNNIQDTDIAKYCVNEKIYNVLNNEKVVKALVENDRK